MRGRFLKLKTILIQTNHVLLFVFASLYLVLVGLETHQKGFVSHSFDLNILLAPIFIAALVLAFTKGRRTEEEVREDHPLLLIMVTVLLFGAAVGYNELRLNSILAEKRIFPEGISELTEHGQSQDILILETVELDKDPAMVLESTDEEPIADIKLKILNGTEIPGLAAAAKKFFTEAGFSSITVGDVPKSNYNTTLVAFRSGMDEWAELIRYLVSENLEVKIRKLAKEASAEENLGFDIVITLATSSILFEPYLPAPNNTLWD